MRPLNTRRHVLFVHPFDALAGSQRVALALIRAFYGLHCSVSVLLGFGSNGFLSRVDGVKVFLSVNHVGLRKALYPLWLAWMVARMLWAVWRREIVWANTIHVVPAVWVALALAFNYGFHLYAASTFGPDVGRQLGLEFLAGYIVEKSLAVDNIFVFLLCFQFRNSTCRA